MKQIRKTSPPGALTRCLKSHPKMDWDLLCTREFSDVKARLANYLREEQGFLCCYCEEEIVKGASHIEHFRPKSQFPALSVDYFNLFASCNGCGKNDDLSCGMKKRDIYFTDLIIPTDPTVEARFIYTADGQILPTDEQDEVAWQTIAVLGLNGPKLRRRREILFQELENLRTLMPPEDFERYIEIRLQKSPKGRFCEFWTTVRYFGLEE